MDRFQGVEEYLACNELEVLFGSRLSSTGVAYNAGSVKASVLTKQSPGQFVIEGMARHPSSNPSAFQASVAGKLKD